MRAESGEQVGFAKCQLFSRQCTRSHEGRNETSSEEFLKSEFPPVRYLRKFFIWW